MSCASWIAASDHTPSEDILIFAAHNKHDDSTEAARTDNRVRNSWAMLAMNYPRSWWRIASQLASLKTRAISASAPCPFGRQAPVMLKEARCPSAISTATFDCMPGMGINRLKVVLDSARRKTSSQDRPSTSFFHPVIRSAPRLEK